MTEQHDPNLSRSRRDDARPAGGAGGDGSRLDAWANPSSPHAEGRQARALLEEARTTVAEVLGWRHDVIFTSGASEAIEIVAARARSAGPRPWRDRTCHRARMRWARLRRSFRSARTG